jgi:hypothetical protein
MRIVFLFFPNQAWWYAAALTRLSARIKALPVRSSCSQILSTLTPWRRSVRFTPFALRTLPAILAFQYSWFCRGIRRQCLQPCQKHPSRKMATRSDANQKSGIPGMSRGCNVHPRIPDLISAILKRTSVERLPLDRTFAMSRLRSFLDSESTPFSVHALLCGRS